MLEPPPKGFEWDPVKNQSCDERYFFTFHDATQIFNDDDYDFLVVADREVVSEDGRSEMRHMAIGMLRRSRLHIAVVYTMREDRIRIITAHPAPEKLRKAFDLHNGIV